MNNQREFSDIMHLVKIDTIDEFKRIEKDWNALLSNSGSDSVFLTHEWMSAWLNSFGYKERLMIMAIYDRDRLVAILPSVIKKSSFRHFPVRSLNFIENDETARSDIIIHKDSRKREIVDLLMKRVMDGEKKEWDIVLFRNISLRSENLQLVKEFADRSNVKYGIKESLESPYIVISENWKEFIGRKSKHFRKRIKDSSKRIMNSGRVNIIHIANFDQFCYYRQKLKEISTKSWLHKQGRDIFGDNDRENFFFNLSRKAGKKGWLNVWLLEIDEEPVAFEYHLIYKNFVHALRAGYAAEFEHLSPGFVLENAIVKKNFERYSGDAIFYDLCGGVSFYKTRWTKNIQEHVNIFVFREDWYGSFLRWMEFGLIENLRDKKHKLTKWLTSKSYDAKISTTHKEDVRGRAKHELMDQYEISEKEAAVISSSREVFEYFEGCCRSVSDPKIVSNWMVNELIGKLKKYNKTLSQCPFDRNQFCELLELVSRKRISAIMGKTVLEKMFTTGKGPLIIVEENELLQSTDVQEIRLLARKVLEQNPKDLKKYREGKQKVINFFVGKVMQQTEGRADPKKIKEVFEDMISSDAMDSGSNA